MLKKKLKKSAFLDVHMELSLQTIWLQAHFEQYEKNWISYYLSFIMLFAVSYSAAWPFAYLIYANREAGIAMGLKRARVQRVLMLGQLVSIWEDK